MQSNFFENHSVSSNAQTPGLPAASTGQVITKEVAFYEKVGELKDTIHSKSEKVCGVWFSVTQNLRKKYVNHDIKISRQKYVNQ